MTMTIKNNIIDQNQQNLKAASGLSPEEESILNDNKTPHTQPGPDVTLSSSINTSKEKETPTTTVDRDQDRQEKLQIVIDEITKLCTDDSEFETLRQIGRAIHDNDDKLCGHNLTGGFTNFSFKICLEKGNPELAVFAKACFPYALWSPDTSVHYDLSRVQCEFDLMRRYGDELRTTTPTGSTETPVPMPYHLIKVSTELYIFVAEWVAPTDEQWGNQFVEGHVDGRVIEKAATTLARINLSKYDEDLNQGYLESMHDIALGFDELFLDIIDKPKTHDRCEEYAKTKLGKERMATIIEEWRRVDESKECMSHSDTHVFNMLVERKPNPTDLSQFGDHGNFFLCDWEMAHAAPKGRDVGLFLAFPVMSAMFLTAQGQIKEAEATIQHLKDFWCIYSKIMVEEGQKDDQYLKEVFRSALGYYGWFSVFAFYLINAMVDANNLDAFTEDEKNEILASVGVAGLKCVDIGLMDDNGSTEMSLDDLCSFFFGVVQEEFQFLFTTVHTQKVQTQRKKRRSSLLRATGRRLSDSEELGKLVRRASAVLQAGLRGPSLTDSSVQEEEAPRTVELSL